MNSCSSRQRFRSLARSARRSTRWRSNEEMTMSAIVHRGASLVRVATAALALSFSLVPAFAEDIHLLCGGAPQRVIHALTAEFERQTGHRLVTTFALVTVIQQKLAAGEKADLVLLPMPLIAAVEKTTPMRAEGRG